MPRIAASDEDDDAPKKSVVTAGDMSLGKVPPKAERLKDSEGQKISKLCGESEWQPRFVCITSEMFTISHPDQDEVSEQIPLHEIASCDRMAGHGDDIIAFVVNTIEGGYNCGRQYIFQVEDEKTFQEWDAFIELQSAIAVKRANKRSPIEEARARARDLLRSRPWQYVFGFIILANFIVNIGQASVHVGKMDSTSTTSTAAAAHRRGAAVVDNHATTTAADLVNASHDTHSTVVVDSAADELARSMAIFDGFDIAFTVLFAIELCINLFGNWFTAFVRSGWSLFDFAVVTVSIISLAVPDGPQWILVLRTMRIFRILRLFHKMRTLRTIINALLAALPIVAQAFMIMALCVFVFTIVGQNLFMTLAPEKFGDFQVSLYTVFEVLTLDKWYHTAELVKDTSKYGDEDVDPTAAIFFSVLIISCVYVLLPVVVAVLLDNFVAQCRAEEKQAVIDEELERMRKAGISKAITLSPIHPVLEALSKFKNSRDLSHKIQALFQVLDCDRGGTLSFQEMAEGLRRMNFSPPIALSQDDFHRMTKEGELCDKDDSLDPAAFEEVMRAELEEHIEHKVALAYEESQKKESPESAALLASVKLLKMLSRHDAGQSLAAEMDKVRAAHRQMLEAMEAQKQRLLLDIKAVERKLSSRGGAGGGAGSMPSYRPTAGPIMQLVDLEPECRDSEAA